MRVGPMFNDRLAIAARSLIVIGGLLLAYPEMITNGVGVLLVIPAVVLAKLSQRAQPVLAAQESGS